jgi:hypothetical protein
MATARKTLSTFAPVPMKADGAKVMATEAVAAPAKAKKPSPVSVYLTREEVRTLKLIGLEHERKVTDICATAIREWLERNGHARGKIFKA